MLQAPIKKLRLFQIRYLVIILFCLVISTTILMTNINSIGSDGSSSFHENDREVYEAAATAIFKSPGSPFSLFMIFFPLIVGILMVVYYIPSYSSVGLSKTNTIKQFKSTPFKIPLRGYTLIEKGVEIRITKKFSSLKGLLMQELLFIVYLPKTYSETKRLCAFLMCEEVNYSSTHIILKKTIKARDTPLHIIRTRALLSVLNLGKA